jgi:membrane-associated phospholipid phosphatase
MAGVATGGELRPNGLRRIRSIAIVAYCGALTWIFMEEGVPTGRLALMVLTIVGLAITSLGYGWRRLLRILVDWLPFTLVLMLYDQSRVVATMVNLPLHEKDIASAESWMFGGNIPAVWMQHHFYTPSAVHWWDAAATLVYVTHFLATPILAAVLWLRNRTMWVAYISRVIALAFAGLVTYVLFPEAPPWLAARDGLIDPVARTSARGWIWLHARNVQELLDSAQRDGANPVAAMPSLHLAFATLVALFIAPHITRRWRYLAALYPVAMGVVLVYTGEHYVLDLMAGAAYALIVHALVSRWERRRAGALRKDQENVPVVVA